jgi:aminoglycoside phosphotransferase (APT) family kinase protein
MLSLHDAGVVAREAAREGGIPSLPILLDEEGFTKWLQTQPGMENLVSTHLQYLRYKPGVRMLAAFELELGGGDRVPAHAWGTPRSDLAKVVKEAGRARFSGSWGPGRILSRRRCLLVELYPEDRRLPTLATFADSAARQRLIDERIPECGGRQWTGFRILSYKPERRFVGALQGEGDQRLVARGYTGSWFSKALRAHRAFQTSNGFRIPELRGFSRSRRVLLTEWMEGRVLDPSTWEPGANGAPPKTGRRGPELARRIGAALAELHGQPARPLRRRAARRESRGLRGAARGVEAVLPAAWGRRARTLAQRLKDRLDDEVGRPWSPTPLHGDFHPDQLLLNQDSLVLLDLDRASLGDPTSDLATFVSHLDRRALEGHFPLPAVSGVEAAFLDGYEEAGGCLDPDRYRLQKAASLLRLAPQPFRERSPAWPSLTRSLVERAENLLTAGSGVDPVSSPHGGVA